MEKYKADVPYTHASIEKAKKDLNFYPITSLEEGIEATIDWYENDWIPYISRSLQ